MKSENRIQQECFMWHWNTYPQYRKLLFHVDNNSADGRQGKLKKQLGVVSGVSDLIFIWNNEVYFIEMKTETGTQDPEQVIFQKQIEAQGMIYMLCRNLKQFIRIIQAIKHGEIKGK